MLDWGLPCRGGDCRVECQRRGLECGDDDKWGLQCGEEDKGLLCRGGECSLERRRVVINESGCGPDWMRVYSAEKGTQQLYPKNKGKGAEEVVEWARQVAAEWRYLYSKVSPLVSHPVAPSQAVASRLPSCSPVTSPRLPSRYLCSKLAYPPFNPSR